MPLFSLLQAQQSFFLYRPIPLIRFRRTPSLCSTMSSNSNSLQGYPTPLSPPLPSISKDIELARAMATSSKSSLFELSRGDILYEDEWLFAVNKPQGIYCDTVLASVNRFQSGSPESDRLCQENQSSTLELHLANRLDRDTSGIMVITKSHKVASMLVKAFTDHKVQKTYVAFCIGSAPQPERITIKSCHGRSKFGAWRVYAVGDIGRKLPGGSVVRDMETTFEVLLIDGQKRCKEPSECVKDEENSIVVEEKAVTDVDAKKDEILVRAFPRSGRTHQIRLHCQYLGFPIRGDVKYEGVCEWKGRTSDAHELHAESLSFQHPITGFPIMIRAPLPSWASQAMQLLTD
ncbi:RNA pseudouridine synthase 1 [Hibiscus syriacus]|uniref:RNA pseudouridine synthase 1 n=1 Tax=Hibiscus syriacus TaxID=106335 RepID=A0A6A2ZHT9_HIBSY|nr:RNA pseudouridine synthase 1-like [Hibiscus syriacus]KAE8691263.1 RNA pseudouridine synthase 1 [Hibiscus syriacus]